MTKSRHLIEMHGESKTRLYSLWANMKNRCYNKNVMSYPLYGGKGITVCDEWRRSFTSFRNWAVAAGYQDGLSIDRISSSDGYYPENCRWATPTQQSCNRHMPRRISIYRGVTFRGKKYQAKLTYAIDGIKKNRHVGWCSTALQAALAYDAAAHREYGEFAVLNFPERYRKAVA